MDLRTTCFVIILLIVGIKSKCEDGVNRGGTIASQRIVCDYRKGDPNLDMQEFGGEVNWLGNGSVECLKYNSEEVIFCMAIIKSVLETDEYGNVTRHFNASTQGCWSAGCNVHDTCPDVDECVSETNDKRKDSATMCCCGKDRCNRDEKLRLVIPQLEVYNSTRGDASVRPTNTAQQKIYIAVVIVVLLSFGSVIGVICFFVLRRNRQSKEKALQRKMDRYNYDMRIYSTEPPVVNYDDLVMGACLHRGRFGDVFRAKLNDREVCVKYFHQQQRPLFITEKEIYMVLDSQVKSVVQCIACDERSHPDGSVQYMVIMEYIELGALVSYLKENTLSWRELCSLAQTASAGLGYLHSESIVNGVYKHAIVHRDINSRNILVRRDLTCAIADMGFSLKIRGSKVIRGNEEELAEDGSLRDVGTVRYMAPEILECAVNLRDCELSLKQIDMYAFSLVLWELMTRCKDILFAEPKTFVLPFEEKLGAHPSFETMRIHVAKEGQRPLMPRNMRHNDATTLLRQTIEDCWDADAEARLSAYCVEERFKEMDSLMEKKGVPMLSKNETNYDKKRGSCVDTVNRDRDELSPLIETDTPASESTCTTLTNLDTPEQNKPDVNIEMERERLLGPTCGRNIMTERNTMPTEAGQDMAVHENTLIPLNEAKARQAAEEERFRRQWEDTMSTQPTEGVHTQRSRHSVQLDIHNEVKEDEPPVRPPKENNLNARRQTSQRNIYESSTSSNGGTGGTVPTIPDRSGVRVGRPKSLNLNIEPDSS
ncbi:activin receptor type-2A-like [Watersipora subatra]|uniref:activin receptor type-2A-like n=1 Tax=Watersipora subatra TaxID=2589382 RepID=UPI00355C3AE6